MSKKSKSTYSTPVRVLALILTGLVASGVLVYLVMFILSLFGIEAGSTHIHV
jgi:hypothetical protein